jgi:CheY-like chemotaxis protein
MQQLKQTKCVVLYADDDPDDRELISAGFVPYKDSIDIRTFSNGADLLAYINSSSLPDNTLCLVILDINMPLLNGLQTLKLIREQKGSESIPIVLFTTYVSTGDKQFINNYNAEILLKPIDASQFHATIDKFVSHCIKKD